MKDIVNRLRPIRDFVLVKRAEADKTTKGGIIIPDNAREKVTRGTVVWTGPGKVLANGRVVEPAVKKGDEVLYGKYSGNECGDDHQIMREEDIYAVVEPE
jgi:chaperonin GroES